MSWGHVLEPPDLADMCLEHGHADGDHVPEPCPACGLRVDGGGEVPQLALARSDRFVRVLSGPVVEQPTPVVK